MALSPVGVPAFDAAALAAERAWQASRDAGWANQAAATAATVARLQAIIAAGLANNVSVGKEQSALSAISSTGNP